MPVIKPSALIISTKASQIEISVTNRKTITIFEINDQSDVPFWVEISIKNWKELKSFVDKKMEEK